MTATPYEALIESASRLLAADKLDDFDEHNISDAANGTEEEPTLIVYDDDTWEPVSDEGR